MCYVRLKVTSPSFKLEANLKRTVACSPSLDIGCYRRRS